jgi:hypothetical protein
LLIVSDDKHGTAALPLYDNIEAVLFVMCLCLVNCWDTVGMDRTTVEVKYTAERSSYVAILANLYEDPLLPPE